MSNSTAQLLGKFDESPPNSSTKVMNRRGLYSKASSSPKREGGRQGVVARALETTDENRNRNIHAKPISKTKPPFSVLSSNRLASGLEDAGTTVVLTSKPFRVAQDREYVSSPDQQPLPSPNVSAYVNNFGLKESLTSPLSFQSNSSEYGAVAYDAASPTVSYAVSSPSRSRKSTSYQSFKGFEDHSPQVNDDYRSNTFKSKSKSSILAKISFLKSWETDIHEYNNPIYDMPSDTQLSPCEDSPVLDGKSHARKLLPDNYATKIRMSKKVFKDQDGNDKEFTTYTSKFDRNSLRSSQKVGSSNCNSAASSLSKTSLASISKLPSYKMTKVAEPGSELISANLINRAHNSPRQPWDIEHGNNCIEDSRVAVCVQSSEINTLAMTSLCHSLITEKAEVNEMCRSHNANYKEETSPFQPSEYLPSSKTLVKSVPQYPQIASPITPKYMCSPDTVRNANQGCKTKKILMKGTPQRKNWLSFLCANATPVKNTSPP